MASLNPIGKTNKSTRRIGGRIITSSGSLHSTRSTETSTRADSGIFAPNEGVDLPQTSVFSTSYAQKVTSSFDDSTVDRIRDETVTADTGSYSVPIGGGGVADGSGVQTPWASNIDAAGHSLTNVFGLSMTDDLDMNGGALLMGGGDINGVAALGADNITLVDSMTIGGYDPLRIISAQADIGLGGASGVSSNIIPAGAVLFGVVVYVSSTDPVLLSNGEDFFNIDVGSSGNAFGNLVRGAVGATTTRANFTINPTTRWSNVAQPVVITAPSGLTFVGGTLRARATFTDIPVAATPIVIA